MFCPNCGKEIEEGAVFCKHCGAKIDDNARLGSAKNALSGSGYTSQNGNAPSTASGGKKPGKVPLAALLLLSIVVAACVGFFGYRAAHKENADVQEAEKENAGAEELQPNAEEEGQADTDAEEQTDRKAGQAADYAQLIADENAEPAGLLTNISWEDINSGNYDTTRLHFSFDDSTDQAVELDYPSAVEKIEYMDITGDGIEEALVYRYFANTATEYTLIDFFKIEPGTAINISPSVYIKELSNEVWDMELLNEYAKGYTSPTLKVTSYGKEDGVAFEQAVYLLGYKDGSWNVIQE